MVKISNSCYCLTRIKVSELVSCTRIKLCKNIGIFIKNYNSTNPGSNKVVYGPCEYESEEKNQNLDFSICKMYLSYFFFFFFGFLFTGPIYNFIWPRISIFVIFCIFTQLNAYTRMRNVHLYNVLKCTREYLVAHLAPSYFHRVK